MAEAAKRRLVTMRLPEDLLAEVEREVGERGRTAFFERAARAELVRRAQLRRVEGFRRASGRRP